MSPDSVRIAFSAGTKIEILEGVPLTPEAKIHLEAKGLIRFLFGKELAKGSVLEIVRARARISDAVRQEALALAEDWQPDIDEDELNNASWATVRQPDAKPDQYKLALKQAEMICRIAPENGYYLNTLGVAQYRVGLYQNAIDTLLRADKINRGFPADLAFLIMAHHQLGHKDKAKVFLERLREIMKQPRWANDKESKAFLREAQQQLQQPGH
jgi:tetratricopeptide (TPR) repeat protein